MKRTVEKLVSFGTRHTLSSQTDPKRGIGAALDWTESEFEYSKACGGCLTTCQPCDTVTGRRIPTPTRVCDIVAIQRGTERPNDVVIITGHIDSRVTDPMDATTDAPGANDDGSGTAAVIEAARVLSKHKFPGTIVYAALSGEEQGLLRRQDPGRLCQGAGLERHRQPQQRHHRQQLLVGRRLQRQGRARFLGRAALAGARGAGDADIRSLGGENDCAVAQHLALSRQPRRPAARSAST